MKTEYKFLIVTVYIVVALIFSYIPAEAYTDSGVWDWAGESGTLHGIYDTVSGGRGTNRATSGSGAVWDLINNYYNLYPVTDVSSYFFPLSYSLRFDDHTNGADYFHLDYDSNPTWAVVTMNLSGNYYRWFSGGNSFGPYIAPDPPPGPTPGGTPEPITCVSMGIVAGVLALSRRRKGLKKM